MGSHQQQHTLTQSFDLAPLSSTLPSLTGHLILVSWRKSRSDVMLIDSSKCRAANKTNDSSIQLFQEACGKLLLVCNTSSEPIRLQTQDHRMRERFEKCHSASNSCRHYSSPSSSIYIQGSSGSATIWGQQNDCLTHILQKDWELTRQLYHWALTTVPFVTWLRSANHDTGMIRTFLPSSFVHESTVKPSRSPSNSFPASGCIAAINSYPV